MFRIRSACSVWVRFRLDLALLTKTPNHRRMSRMGCKGEALDGGRGGVPHNKVPPSPGEEKGARGMRSTGLHDQRQ